MGRGLLAEKVVVVTGASRGVGRGIALALGAQGATVYVTGRNLHESPRESFGALQSAAEDITKSGGRGIPLHCNHADDSQVEKLFARVEAENGRLDILVNNATSLASNPFAFPPFWKKSLEIGDQFVVGLRSAFVASYYAAPLLIAAENSLLVNISYYGAVSYHLDPAYGATKAGLDKLTFDMAEDFAPYGVTVISLWPGPTATERAVALVSKIPGGEDILKAQETTTFSGRVLEALYLDPAKSQKSGQVVIAAEAALEYGILDANGKQPPIYREQKGSPRKFFKKT